ncbi:hypothetical protein SCHPADRAFT_790003, partial [Schizopora paradoxa]
EIMNQILEIALRAYIGPERDDWSELLGPLQLAYNSSVQTSTGFSPAFLLRGYEPRTGLTIDTNPEGTDFENETSLEFKEHFDALRQQARDALTLAQSFQRTHYNKGR